MFQELLEEEEAVRDAVIRTYAEVVGPRRSHQMEWMFMDTLHKVQERKQKKEAVKNSYGTRAAKACGE